MVEIVDRVVSESVEKEDIKGFTPETVVWPFGRKGPVIFTNVGGEARRLRDWPIDPTGPCPDPMSSNPFSPTRT